MHRDDQIRPAVVEDLGFLRDIEKSAAGLFRKTGIRGDFLNHFVPAEDLAEAQAHGRLWVAVHRGKCVGFACVCLLDDREPWLDEIDVHPDHGRRGLGRGLVQRAIAWSRYSGARSLALTTFRDVAWNAPFYSRLGFREVPVDEQSRCHRAILDEETERGLPMDRRVLMRLGLAPEK